MCIRSHHCYNSHLRKTLLIHVTHFGLVGTYTITFYNSPIHISLGYKPYRFTVFFSHSEPWLVHMNTWYYIKYNKFTYVYDIKFARIYIDYQKLIIDIVKIVMRRHCRFENLSKRFYCNLRKRTRLIQ